MEADIYKRIQEITATVLKQGNYTLFDLTIKRRGSTADIQILADRTYGGITLEECADLNRKINSLIEHEGLFMGDYTLELSSPGIDRPMKTKNDFLRAMHQPIRIMLRERVNGKYEYIGELLDASDEKISISLGDKIIDIPLVKIQKAVQHYRKD